MQFSTFGAAPPHNAKPGRTSYFLNTHLSHVLEPVLTSEFAIEGDLMISSVRSVPDEVLVLLERQNNI